MVVLVVAIVVAVVFFAVLFNYHFLLTDDGFVAVEKESWGPETTFANTKNWDFNDWMKHPEVAEALAKREIESFIDSF